MMRKISVYLLSIAISMVLLMRSAFASESCNIYIHGYSKDTSYWNHLPRHINWNSALELESAADELAPKLWTEISGCKKIPVFLRTHDYAASVVYYILGLGRRYADLYPQHNFVKIYKGTTAVYSMGGAFRGTPLMDYVCGDGKSKTILDVIGNQCILSLTTSEIYHSSATVNSPGVPIYLIWGTNDREYGVATRELMQVAGLSWEEHYQETKKNRSDGVIPQFSSMACEHVQAITETEGDCPKINREYFINFFRSDDYSHSDLARDKELLQRVYNEN